MNGVLIILANGPRIRRLKLPRQLGWCGIQARFYDPMLMRFTQPDTILPDPGDPQALNRYGGACPERSRRVVNNPLRYTDPTGRCQAGDPYAGYLCRHYGHDNDGGGGTEDEAPGPEPHEHDPPPAQQGDSSSAGCAPDRLLFTATPGGGVPSGATCIAEGGSSGCAILNPADCLGSIWLDFQREISDPRVWKPLAGAGLIIVADVPGVGLDVACILGGAPSAGLTCVAAEAYFFLVFLPATDLGICLITGEEFILPGTQPVCTHG